jgi:hypothetical protein
MLRVCFYAAPRQILPQISHLPLSALTAPLGGAAAAEEQGAIKALDMGESICGFERARSHPAKVIKGAKAA